jgi:MEMO1 family protein
VRPPALAGTWYPDGRARLVAGAHLLMRLAAGPALPGRPVALVVPHAGWNYSGLAAATAFRQLSPGDFERVVVVAPSHHGSFRGYALDDARAWRTPIGDVPLCDGAAAALRGGDAGVPKGVGAKEHAVEVLLPFLQASLGRFCLVPVLTGDTDEGMERAFASRLAALHDGRTLFVFSTDFAHYGPRFSFRPFGALSPSAREKIRALDERAVALLANVDGRGFRGYLQETKTTICGRHALATMLELLPRIAPGARAVTLAHYASADIPGREDTSSVTYVTMAFLPAEAEAAPTGPPLVGVPLLEEVGEDAPPLAPEDGARLVRVARSALVTHFFGRDDLGRELRAWPAGPGQERRQGVFVTLNRRDPAEARERGRMRGCQGQAEPAFPLYYGAVHAALDAALADRRFDPLTSAELPGLEVEVTVLSRMRPVDSWRDIRLGTHGIALKKGDKGALFLPQVPGENGWGLERTLAELAEKAGLPRDGWKEEASLSVFTGQVFAEGH